MYTSDTVEARDVLPRPFPERRVAPFKPALQGQSGW